MSTTTTRSITDDELADAYQAVLDDWRGCDPADLTHGELSARLAQLRLPREQQALQFLARHPELTGGAYSITIYHDEIGLQVRQHDSTVPDSAELTSKESSVYPEYTATIDGQRLSWVVA